MDRYFVKVDMAYRLLLKKQHELLTSRHSNVAVIAWPEVVEIRADDVIQDESRQQQVAEMGPTRGIWSHSMTWFQVTGLITEQMCEQTLAF